MGGVLEWLYDTGVGSIILDDDDFVTKLRKVVSRMFLLASMFGFAGAYYAYRASGADAKEVQALEALTVLVFLFGFLMCLPFALYVHFTKSAPDWIMIYACAMAGLICIGMDIACVFFPMRSCAIAIMLMTISAKLDSGVANFLIVGTLMAYYILMEVRDAWEMTELRIANPYKGSAVEKFLFSFPGICAATLIPAMVAAMVHEFVRMITSAKQSVMLAQDISQLLIRYDTDGVRDFLELTQMPEAEGGIEGVSHELVEAFTQIAANLDVYRPHIPAYVLPQNDDDAEMDQFLSERMREQRKKKRKQRKRMGNGSGDAGSDMDSIDQSQCDGSKRGDDDAETDLASRRTDAESFLSASGNHSLNSASGSRNSASGAGFGDFHAESSGGSHDMGERTKSGNNNNNSKQSSIVLDNSINTKKGSIRTANTTDMSPAGANTKRSPANVLRSRTKDADAGGGSSSPTKSAIGQQIFLVGMHVERVVLCKVSFHRFCRLVCDIAQNDPARLRAQAQAQMEQLKQKAAAAQQTSNNISATDRSEPATLPATSSGSLAAAGTTGDAKLDKAIALVAALTDADIAGVRRHLSGAMTARVNKLVEGMLDHAAALDASVHSMIGDTIITTWNATMRTSHNELKCCRFLLGLKSVIKRALAAAASDAATAPSGTPLSAGSKTTPTKGGSAPASPSATQEPSTPRAVIDSLALLQRRQSLNSLRSQNSGGSFKSGEWSKPAGATPPFPPGSSLSSGSSGASKSGSGTPSAAAAAAASSAGVLASQKTNSNSNSNSSTGKLSAGAASSSSGKSGTGGASVLNSGSLRGEQPPRAAGSTDGDGNTTAPGSRRESFIGGNTQAPAAEGSDVCAIDMTAAAAGNVATGVFAPSLAATTSADAGNDEAGTGGLGDVEDVIERSSQQAAEEEDARSNGTSNSSRSTHTSKGSNQTQSTASTNRPFDATDRGGVAGGGDDSTHSSGGDAARPSAAAAAGSGDRGKKGDKDKKGNDKLFADASGAMVEIPADIVSACAVVGNAWCQIAGGQKRQAFMLSNFSHIDVLDRSTAFAFEHTMLCVCRHIQSSVQHEFMLRGVTLLPPEGFKNYLVTAAMMEQAVDLHQRIQTQRVGSMTSGDLQNMSMTSMPAVHAPHTFPAANAVSTNIAGIPSALSAENSSINVDNRAISRRDSDNGDGGTQQRMLVIGGATTSGLSSPQTPEMMQAQAAAMPIMSGLATGVNSGGNSLRGDMLSPTTAGASRVMQGPGGVSPFAAALPGQTDDALVTDLRGGFNAAEAARALGDSPTAPGVVSPTSMPLYAGNAWATTDDPHGGGGSGALSFPQLYLSAMSQVGGSSQQNTWSYAGGIGGGTSSSAGGAMAVAGGGSSNGTSNVLIGTPIYELVSKRKLSATEDEWMYMLEKNEKEGESEESVLCTLLTNCVAQLARGNIERGHRILATMQRDHPSVADLKAFHALADVVQRLLRLVAPPAMRRHFMHTGSSAGAAVTLSSSSGSHAVHPLEHANGSFATTTTAPSGQQQTVG